MVEWFKSVFSVRYTEETHACLIGLELPVLFNILNVLVHIICST